jgi:hypothetical protein
LPEEDDGATLRIQVSVIGLRKAVRTRTTDAVGDIWEATLETVLRTRLIERTTERLLSEGVVERMVTLVVEHPATERTVTLLLESTAVERLVLSIGQSELVDRMLNRVLASEQLDRVVKQIAESEEVRNALREQSAGMADDVTDELRSRTVAADAMLERFARSVIRRQQRTPQDSGPTDSGAI